MDGGTGSLTPESAEHEHQARRGAEVRFRDAAVDEAGGAVETHRVRIGGDFQALCPPRPQDLGDAADERGGNTAPHIARVHEQVFQLDSAGGLSPGGEPDNRAVLLRDMSAALG